MLTAILARTLSKYNAMMRVVLMVAIGSLLFLKHTSEKILKWQKYMAIHVRKQEKCSVFITLRNPFKMLKEFQSQGRRNEFIISSDVIDNME